MYLKWAGLNEIFKMNEDNNPLMKGTIVELFDEYEACLQHYDAGILLGQYEYAYEYRESSKYLLRVMKEKPIMDKLNFVLKLYGWKDLAEEKNDPVALMAFNEYIRLFWEEVI